MSMAQYLWSAATALRLQVRPAVEENSARDALDNSIRVLTAVANALEPEAAAPPPPALAGRAEAATDHLGGPPENAAARRASGTAIAEVAAGFEKNGDIASDEARAAIAWEKAMLDASIAAFDAVERALPATEVDPAQNIDPAALERFLRGWSGNQALAVEEFKLVVGGRSRQTALFKVANAPDLPAALVVQRGIPGLVGFASERLQFNLLSTLRDAGMRVPRPILVEEASEHLGAPFMIVERSPGSPVLTDYWGGPDSEGVILDLAREMALLHAQPLGALADQLPQSRQSYDIEGWKAELETLANDWNSLAHWPSVTMSAVIAWLRANVDCLDDRRGIVHNDMVFHNILAEDGRISAILDWEQVSIGHPGEDLGYCYPYVAPAIDWDKFLAAYRAAGGPDIPQRQISYFALRAGLRLMILVMQGGRDTFEKGQNDNVLVASAGAHFTQRLLHRVAGVLASVLDRAD